MSVNIKGAEVRTTVNPVRKVQRGKGGKRILTSIVNMNKGRDYTKE